MRRADREVIEKDEIVDIIGKCDVCRIALCHNDMPYVVPLNFGYEFEKGKLVLYFHCAAEGKKLDMINQNSKVCFEMDCSHKLIEGDIACKYTMEYESVIGLGIIEQVTGIQDKKHGMKLLMNQYVQGKEFAFSDEQVNSLTVLKLNVDEFSGKKLKR